MGRQARTLSDELYTEGGVSRPQHFQDCLVREVARARRYGNPVSLLLIGIDKPRLRAVSRSSARSGSRPPADARDRVAAAVVEATRTTDVVVAREDDQVAALLPETQAGAALVLAERLRALIDEQGPRRPKLRVRVGVAAYRPDANYGPDDLLFEAESALDAARRKRDGVAIFDA